MKLPYEHIIDNAFRLIDLSVTFDGDCSDLFLDEYYLYLYLSGWTDEEFDNETLRRIDSSWEILIN